MKLRFVLPTLALAVLGFFSTSAQAQIGIYLNPVFDHVSMSKPDTGPYSFLGDGVTSRWFGGVDYGAYWDFLHYSSFSVGLDVRDTILHGNNAKLNTFSVGARIAGNPIKYGLRPYAEVSAGAGHSKAELSTLPTTRAQFDFLAGIDYPLGKHLDWRAVEVGYGTVDPMSSEVIGQTNCTTTSAPGGPLVTTCTPIPSANLIHLSSGLVFRFGK